MAEVTNALGRRKAAVARVYLTAGKGEIKINSRDLENYFPDQNLQFIVKQPLATLGVTENYDIKANLDGGGIKEGAPNVLQSLGYIYFGDFSFTLEYLE